MRKLRILLWTYVKQKRTRIFECVVFHCIYQLKLFNMIKYYAVNFVRFLNKIENVFVDNEWYAFPELLF